MKRQSVRILGVLFLLFVVLPVAATACPYTRHDFPFTCGAGLD